MATKKKAVTKKSAATAPTKPINNKLHIVLGDQLMAKFERKCKRVGMTKSEIGRLLIEFFVKNDMDVTPPVVTSTKVK